MKTQVKVKPNTKISQLSQTDDGHWFAQLKSANGKANQELLKLIVKAVCCRKADVTLKSGTTGPMKLIEIAQ